MFVEQGCSCHYKIPVVKVMFSDTVVRKDHGLEYKSWLFLV